MAKVNEAIDISAPIDRVFDTVTNPRRARELFPNVLTVEGLPDGPLVAGTTWQQTTKMGRREAKITCRIVSHDPPHEGVLEMSGDEEGKVITRCEDLGGATRLKQDLDVRLTGSRFLSLISHFITPMVRREIRKSLERAKEVIEREAATTSGPGA